MVKVGLLFAGQGAQFVGMGKDYYDASPAAKAVFDKAAALLGEEFLTTCFEGPEEELKKTVNTQVAIFTTSVAMLAALKEKYPSLEPAVSMGLSLGEYAALVASGVATFEQLLPVVQKRGVLMEEAAHASHGGMVSAIGLDDALCAEVAEACGIDVANFNSPGQIVLSGVVEGVDKAEVLLKEKGAKKAVRLNVSGAFHSRLMASAGEGMKSVLEAVALIAPSSMFIPNVTARAETDPEKIKELLVSQVSNSVKWTQSMQAAIQDDVKIFIEIGPGKVLKGLARRIDKETTVTSIESYEALETVQELIG